MKGEVIKVNVTPKKRVLRSIARDLDLTRPVLELIDNSIDAWKINNTGTKLVINIHVSKKDSKLIFKDNAGGVSMSSISQLFTLGDTGRSARRKRCWVRYLTVLQNSTENTKRSSMRWVGTNTG